MAEHGDERTESLRDLAEQGLEEALSLVRGNGGGLGGRASRTMGALLTELGVVQKRDFEELELRVAQLEHRIKLLEEQADTARSGTDATSGE